MRLTAACPSARAANGAAAAASALAITVRRSIMAASPGSGVMIAHRKSGDRSRSRYVDEGHQGSGISGIYARFHSQIDSLPERLKAYLIGSAWPTATCRPNSVAAIG